MKLQNLKASAKNLIRYNRFLRSLVTLRMIDYRFPSVIGIDPTNLCNLKCGMCASAQNKADSGFMDMGMFNRIIDESLKYGKRWMIILHNFGEPLMHPEISKMIRIIKQKKAARVVQFATNGLLGNETVFEGLIDSRLDSITFSVDAYTAKEYMELKGLDGLEKVKANIRLMMDLKKRKRSAFPWVCAKMVKRRGFEHTFKPFLKEWSKIVDEALLTPYSNWGGSIKYDGVDDIAIKRYACHFLWYYPVVGFNGLLWSCCASVSPEAVIGDLKHQSLFEIWNGKRLKEIRAGHLKKDFKQIPFCGGCTYWSESRVNLDYFLKPS